MPSTIPYDPSLVLANIVHPDRLANIQAIAKAQGPADSAEDALNSFITMRRSLQLTVMEMSNLGVSTDALAKATKDLDKQIQEAAIKYVEEKIKAELAIQPLRANILQVHSDVESPVDYMRTDFKSMPLAANSLNMDVQYFSRDADNQDSSTFSGTVGAYISASMSRLGTDLAGQVSTQAAAQISRQVENHSIEGTLVLSLTCTHQNARMLAPFAINVDKGIHVWNRLFPKDKMSADNPEAMVETALKDDADSSKSFSIISGVTYGSSFVGMVHILNKTDTSASERMTDVATQLQAQMDAGSWFQHFSGGFGVSTDMANDVKNLISAQNITSHVTLIAMGVIPSVVANDVNLAVEHFADFDADKVMGKIAALQNATQSDQTSVKSAADAARTGQQMVSMQNAQVQGVLSGLGQYQDGSNKVIDINSMMTAMQDFLTQAASGNAGVPINYYLKEITPSMLAQMWVAKYMPGKYLALQNDDLPPAPGTTAGNTGSMPASATADSSAPPASQGTAS